MLPNDEVWTEYAGLHEGDPEALSSWVGGFHAAWDFKTRKIQHRIRDSSK